MTGGTMKTGFLFVSVVVIALLVETNPARLRRDKVRQSKSYEDVLVEIASCLPASNQSSVSGGGLLQLESEEAGLLAARLRGIEGHPESLESRKASPCEYSDLKELVAKLDGSVETTLAETQAAHAQAQKFIKDSYDNISHCSNPMPKKVAADKIKFDRQVEAHAACRESERAKMIAIKVCGVKRAGLKDTMDSKEELVKNVEQKLLTTGPGSNDVFGNWMTQRILHMQRLLGEWNQAMTEYSKAKDAYDAAVAECAALEASKPDCDELLKKLDDDSCLVVSEQQTLCETCYQEALDGYALAKTRVEQEVASRKTTWREEKAAECLLKGMSAKLQSSASRNAGQAVIRECETLADDSVLDIVPPVPTIIPADAQCDMLESYPCNDKYVQIVYVAAGLPSEDCKQCGEEKEEEKEKSSFTPNFEQRHSWEIR